MWSRTLGGSLVGQAAEGVPLLVVSVGGRGQKFALVLSACAAMGWVHCYELEHAP